MADLIDSSPQRVRFGAFEVDLRAGELWKSGRKRKLAGQPFSVLAILLEHPGEVVTREELQKRLWPDTFVDVDHNLNAAINKIREALDDSPERPRFVETLSRRGYRFIAPVEIVKPVEPAHDAILMQSMAVSDAASQGDGAKPLAAPSPAITEAPPPPAIAVKPRNWPRTALWSTAAVAALAVIAALAWLFRPALPPPALSGYAQLTHDGKGKYLIGTDGSRLYFHIDVGDIPAQMSVNGGNEAPVRIDLPGTKLYQVSSVSPDGSKLLIAQLSGFSNASVPMWSVPTLGGSPIRLADILGSSGAWSPDGQRLVYVHGDALYLANADGTESRELASLPGPLAGPSTDTSEGENISTSSPVWSPDGRTIALTLVTSKAQINQLWEVSADGSNLHEMFPGWNSQTGACCGSWTPDEKYFIFESQGQIWVARQAGSLTHKVSREPVQLTSGAVSYAYPVPGKDGKTVYAVETIPRGELQRYDRGKKHFDPILGGISAQDVAFLKDGEWVAYVSYPDGILWRSRLDGSEKLQLSSPPVYALNPTWSPDGTEIVYCGLEKGRPARIYEVSVLGGTPQQLMPNGNGNQADPTWSPDGDRLVFGGTGYAATNGIQILDIKTHQVSKVAGSDGMYSPRWSPDGGYLAALPADESGLMVFDFKAGKWRMLFKGEASYPCWSHDGRFVYFLHFPDQAVDRVAVLSGRVEEIVSLKAFQFTGFYGFWLGLAPDDSPLQLKDTGTEEIVSMKLTAP